MTLFTIAMFIVIFVNPLVNLVFDYNSTLPEETLVNVNRRRRRLAVVLMQQTFVSYCIFYTVLDLMNKNKINL